MSDQEEQDDEACVLQSIYNEEELAITTEEDGLKSGKFFAFVNLPKGFCIKYKARFDDSEFLVVPVDHLPPILLSFKLPKNYPSESMPEFTLSCVWMTVRKLVILCDKLESLWSENKGSVILYTWTNFVKEESLDFLKIGNNLDITALNLKGTRRLSAAKPAELKDENDEKRIRNRQRKPIRQKVPRPLDPRVVVPSSNMPLHQFLYAYNEDRTMTTFSRNIFFCQICYLDVAGSNCIEFRPCKHVYCKDCMGQYFKTRISEAQVTTMPCPQEKCSSEANPQQVKDVVGPSLFTKYDNLLLNVTLDQMDDITYCPRVACGSAVVRDGDDKMAACPACRYAFCVYCKRAYHGVEPCRMKSAEVKRIVDEYQKGDSATRANLEKRYGRAQIQGFVNDMLSSDWIETNSKNCPKCDASIEKSEGCNKMACGKCQSNFCWLCLAILDRNKPYVHFQDTTSRCFNQLFLGIENNVPLDQLDEAFFFEEDDDELYDYEEEFLDDFDSDDDLFVI
ncbi:IBR [Nesidiocoris tenuis]|uniref:RBR-type E3 ubiquitin transferase n=1 Tax=Nesidiocoris tenuis TaxID=355587 RepID=A0ABN7APP3_9HEMI|nr:IBR [Nesidiocoris tenuis]